MNRYPQADKRLGQHFLSSPHVISAITQDIPVGVDAIIEVGPGPAVLTPHLAKHGLPVYAFEMDQRFAELLKEVIPAEHIRLGDALEVDWENFFREKKIKRAWMVSNLPYNVSVPLTLAFMREPGFQRLTLMYQKEVAEKFNPRDRKNEMSSLHTLAATFFHVARVVDVPPGAFVPPPKVMSQVLRFDRLAQPLVPLAEWPSLENFLRDLFQNRRKQLQGVIKERIPNEQFQQFCREEEVPFTIRAEALTHRQVLKLYQLDHKH